MLGSGLFPAGSIAGLELGRLGRKLRKLRKLKIKNIFFSGA
jgi:hypothetical protein